MKRFFKNIGPGTLVAAAFIGPGTVTVCSIAGVTYGFTLLWAMVLSIVATIVLQEMAARLGIVHNRGLAATVKAEIEKPFIRNLAIGLILAAILIGNAAYEAGNISGGVLGLETIFQDSGAKIAGIEMNMLSLIIGAIAFLVLYLGNYKVIEKFLISLVLLMSISFLITAVLTKPQISEVLKGMFIPKFPEESWLTIIALVGTTVVPYNLFLHASLVKEKWKDSTHLKAARIDTYISILLGGIVSLAIIICAAAVRTSEVNNAADLAMALEPLYGEYATYLLSIGLFAAGITSAITAPLAAAYVARDCFGWQGDLKSVKFRGVWMVILALGVVFSSIGFKPIEIIRFAQVANGLLLPIIAGFLLWVVNRTNVLGGYRNNWLQNLLGILILITTIVLGSMSLVKVYQSL
ncbi:MAG: Nramp family divalent metal transporter [Bacteroidia bacterium]|nr:Nramp family divalent metal transporter [Bacteroidia bacterium]MBT8275870.1 Nramp family divalent metal transporter [Bacteroidia bacterium]NNF31244.1 Nramp family divalent metal transporter [Flavobacteriaceae bacterium]NNK54561.1 Nramp family divalent metal transporter [Flavobacteriaceae bacterium]NNM09370.1 Nramp family divalent metal transporter [Flavobacteriaceae bacterium]